MGILVYFTNCQVNSGVVKSSRKVKLLASAFQLVDDQNTDLNFRSYFIRAHNYYILNVLNSL